MIDDGALPKGAIERHNVQDAAGGSGTMRTKTRTEKSVQSQLAQAFKDGAAYVASSQGVAKGTAFERACTECAERRTKEIVNAFNKAEK